MRWAQFKAQLPTSPAAALAAVDGALMGERADPQMEPEELADAKVTRLGLMQAVSRAVRK